MEHIYGIEHLMLYGVTLVTLIMGAAGTSWDHTKATRDDEEARVRRYVRGQGFVGVDKNFKILGE